MRRVTDEEMTARTRAMLDAMTEEEKAGLKSLNELWDRLSEANKSAFVGWLVKRPEFRRAWTADEWEEILRRVRIGAALPADVEAAGEG
jgi:hypothetical protein